MVAIPRLAGVNATLALETRIIPQFEISKTSQISIYITQNRMAVGDAR
jgi:hypothetical protein